MRILNLLIGAALLAVAGSILYENLRFTIPILVGVVAILLVRTPKHV